LCARTRYLYVVRDASPLSVKAVAVPATTATWAKFVQPDPLQRSILTSVWLVVVFVHFSPIELFDRAIAVKLAGALGRAGAFTTMDAVVVFDALPLSVTVKVAVYAPGVEYACVVVTPAPKVPSPNAHAHDVTVPKASVERDPSNVTVRGAVPDEGVADMIAVGGGLSPTMLMVAVFEYAEYPPALEARTR
jgi:hypothetical protein